VGNCKRIARIQSVGNHNYLFDVTLCDMNLALIIPKSFALDRLGG
jgi:hypothetical protein